MPVAGTAPRGFAFRLQLAQRRQIVLDVLIGGEHGIAIVGHLLLIGRLRLIRLRRRAGRPRKSAARHAGPPTRTGSARRSIERGGALESARGGEGELREIGGPRDWPICALAAATRRSASAMSGRRSSSVDGRPGSMGGGADLDRQGLTLKAERGGVLADQHGDGMLRLGALQADIRRLREGVVAAALGPVPRRPAPPRRR